MKNITFQWNNERELSKDELISLLHSFGDLLPNPLAARMNISDYATKLLTHADIGLAFAGEEVVGFLCLYANDIETRNAHWPLLSILPTHTGRGLGKVMMSRGLALCRQRGMNTCDLEVQATNTPAHRLYLSCGFRFDITEGDGWTMRCTIPSVTPKSATTPIEEHPRLAARLDLDIDLRIKRDDLYPATGGGNKARIIEYILREMVAQGQDVLVTNGGPQSNNARASAVLAATLGIKCHLVIVLEPGISYPDTGNILLMRLSGATIEFCQKNQLAEHMDKAVEYYKNLGHNPRYVWGGGHCLAGTTAFFDASAEAQTQCGNWQPDFLILASGTGTTLAGLATGYANSTTQIIGISVARDTTRGSHITSESVTEYLNSVVTGAKKTSIDIDFRDDWTDGGYERTSPQLLEIIEKSATAGVFVDPTYSGKALHGLVELVKRGEIPSGSRVLFWHTGGLMNLQASPLVGSAISL